MFLCTVVIFKKNFVAIAYSIIRIGHVTQKSMVDGCLGFSTLWLLKNNAVMSNLLSVSW